MSDREGREMRGPNRTRLFRITLGQKAKATLRRVRFSSGRRVGGIELSPLLSARQQRQLESWIRRLPPAFLERIPRLKLAVAERLSLVRDIVLINERAAATTASPVAHTHAASYIVARYVVLQETLFDSRVELGRILYHELCHFLWPRLGNPKRRKFAALLQREFRQGTRGELGYSSEWRKKKLTAVGSSQLRKIRNQRLWQDYVCESFCDTGAYVLLGSERRPNHSEFTLSRASRERRVQLWVEMVFEDLSGSGEIFPGKGACVLSH